jgi:hypothetical protein
VRLAVQDHHPVDHASDGGGARQDLLVLPAVEVDGLRPVLVAGVVADSAASSPSMSSWRVAMSCVPSRTGEMVAGACLDRTGALFAGVFGALI